MDNVELMGLPTGNPTEAEVAELTRLFPKSYPVIRERAEKYRPKTKEEWDAFAKFHDELLKSLPSVKPDENYKPIHFRFNFKKG